MLILRPHYHSLYYLLLNQHHFYKVKYIYYMKELHDYYIYKAQALAANATFEHTSKFVLTATDVLSGRTADSADVDVVISYLDQTL